MICTPCRQAADYDDPEQHSLCVGSVQCACPHRPIVVLDLNEKD